MLRSPGKKVCTVHCVSFTMHCMVASSIPCTLSLCADRVHARAGDSYVSSGIDVACPTTQSVLAIASPHELHGSSSLSSSTGTRSFCCTQQFSITSITTSAGAVTERYAYSAYGQLTILDATASVLSSFAINNRYTYTGREWDAALELHHFRARWLSPIAGRFLGRDPIGNAGSPDDLYEFLESRTLFFTDPLGKIVGIPGRMICCGGTTIWSGPGATEGSCGNKVYRKMTECCDATGPLIHTKRNQAQCCAAAKAAG